MIVTVDFETEAIDGNPVLNPPRPVGVAVWVPGEEPWYEPISTSIGFLQDCWEHHELLFHNAPFDLSVAEKWLGLEWPKWDRIHDTQYLVFHYDPYGDLGLKPASERILGLTPDEKNDLHNWILANVPEATKKTAGAYICRAPIELVRPYAIGDVVRTRQLFDFITEQNVYAKSV